MTRQQHTPTSERQPQRQPDETRAHASSREQALQDRRARVIERIRTHIEGGGRESERPAPLFR